MEKLVDKFIEVLQEGANTMEVMHKSIIDLQQKVLELHKRVIELEELTFKIK